MTPLIKLDAQMCEIMYAHYAERLADPSVPPHFKVYLGCTQLFWLQSHELVVPIEQITNQLIIQ